MHPFPEQNPWSQSFLPIKLTSQSSVYITLQSPGKKKTEETSEQLWRKKKTWRASWRYKFFFLLCCLWCQFDPFNPYLSPLISHISRKRSILLALACCCCLFPFLRPFILLLVWLSCFIYLICGFSREDACPLLTSAFFGSPRYARSLFKVKELISAARHIYLFFFSKKRKNKTRNKRLEQCNTYRDTHNPSDANSSGSARFSLLSGDKQVSETFPTWVHRQTDFLKVSAKYN